VVYRYGGAWRNTNDLDVYIERKYIPAAIEILSHNGDRDARRLPALHSLPICVHPYSSAVTSPFRRGGQMSRRVSVCARS
jgi:hypothetical protein